MKKLLLFVFLFSILIPFIQAETYISEIMYNPKGDDNNFEYIEIYTNISLDNFTIKDLDSEDLLKLVKSSESNFALIVEEKFNYSEGDANIYSAGATIGNNLNNNRDVIALFDKENNLVDAISYSSTEGGDGNGYSLCKIPGKMGKLQECFPTAGEINNEEVEYKIKINEILPNPLGDDNAAMPFGEWIELYNYGGIDVDLDGFELRDDFGHSIFISNSQVIGSTIIKEDDFLVVYINGKSGFLNNEDFEKVSLIDYDKNEIDTITYSGSSEDVSWALVENKLLLSNPTINRENPKKEKDIEADSKIIIKNIYLGTDNKAKWGDNIRVNLEVYKGDTEKTSVQMWIGKEGTIVSKRTKFNVHKKFDIQEFTVPVQIYPNCRGNLRNGVYTLYVEGLDTLDTIAEKRLEINGLASDLCEQKTNKEDVFYEIVDVPTKVNIGEEFVTKLKITNEFEENKEFSVWSHINNENQELREENRTVLKLPPHGSGTVEIVNKLETEGEVLLDINILEEGKKRARKMSNSIKVVGQNDNFFENVINEDNEVTGEIAYSSKNVKQRKLIIYFFIFVIAMISLYGLFKND